MAVAVRPDAASGNAHDVDDPLGRRDNTTLASNPSARAANTNDAPPPTLYVASAPDTVGAGRLASQFKCSDFLPFDKLTASPEPSADNDSPAALTFGANRPGPSDTNVGSSDFQPSAVNARYGALDTSVVNVPSGFANVDDEAVRSFVISTREP